MSLTPAQQQNTTAAFRPAHQSPNRPQVAAPGDVIMLLPDDGAVTIGAGGLRPEGGAVVASKCGVVRRTRGGQLWLEGRQKRWVARWLVVQVVEVEWCLLFG